MVNDDDWSWGKHVADKYDRDDREATEAQARKADLAAKQTALTEGLARLTGADAASINAKTYVHAFQTTASADVPFTLQALAAAGITPSERTGVTITEKDANTTNISGAYMYVENVLNRALKGKGLPEISDAVKAL